MKKGKINYGKPTKNSPSSNAKLVSADKIDDISHASSESMLDICDKNAAVLEVVNDSELNLMFAEQERDEKGYKANMHYGKCFDAYNKRFFSNAIQLPNYLTKALFASEHAYVVCEALKIFSARFIVRTKHGGGHMRILSPNDILLENIEKQVKFRLMALSVKDALFTCDDESKIGKTMKSFRYQNGKMDKNILSGLMKSYGTHTQCSISAVVVTDVINEIAYGRISQDDALATLNALYCGTGRSTSNGKETTLKSLMKDFNDSEKRRKRDQYNAKYKTKLEAKKDAAKASVADEENEENEPTVSIDVVSISNDHTEQDFVSEESAHTVDASIRLRKINFLRSLNEEQYKEMTELYPEFLKVE